ncbi:MAG TPA: sigma-70 family RNA polymerase sigma factor, partial [Thermoanaerobaculia bacterium]|nr:sigma-70 family RNA polymerase sigma factor [Thermoanaerobaculia bacterium]
PDMVLLRLIGERRPEAVSRLYDRHAPMLLALARRILGSTADAEEVLQEVFLHVWDHCGRYDPARSSVSTWLVLLTRSRAIDRLRHRNVVERTHEQAHASGTSEGTDPRDDASPGGPDAVLIRERRERVRRELEGLPPEQRQVLEMAFYEGLSQSEISARAGLPLGTVKTRTLLAMKKLRNALRMEIRELL